MKRFLTAILLSLAFSAAAAAQEADSLKLSAVDSLLVGKDILNIIGPGISISQSPSVRTALKSASSGLSARKASISGTAPTAVLL